MFLKLHCTSLYFILVGMHHIDIPSPCYALKCCTMLLRTPGDTVVCTHTNPPHVIQQYRCKLSIFGPSPRVIKNQPLNSKPQAPGELFRKRILLFFLRSVLRCLSAAIWACQVSGEEDTALVGAPRETFLKKLKTRG